MAITVTNDYLAFCGRRNRAIKRIEWIDKRSDITADCKFELKRILADEKELSKKAVPDLKV